MKDTSIMTNLRQQGLKKSPKHRNWMEWNAIYDHVTDELADMEKRLFNAKNEKWVMYFYGTSFGLILSYVINYL